MNFRSKEGTNEPVVAAFRPNSVIAPTMILDTVSIVASFLHGSRIVVDWTGDVGAEHQNRSPLRTPHMGHAIQRSCGDGDCSLRACFRTASNKHAEITNQRNAGWHHLNLLIPSTLR